jgi:DNA-binding response OmpR family regulator
VVARILVVDDQPHVTVCLSVFLAKQGHEVTRAHDGKGGLRLLREEPFDLLITDVDMPELDGLSLIAHEDAVSQLRGVIVLTGRTDYEEIAAMRAHAAVHVSPKPFSPSRLCELVARLLADDADAALQSSATSA